MLFFTTGLFTECVRGQYGTNCYLTCGHCSDTVTSCDHVRASARHAKRDGKAKNVTKVRSYEFLILSTIYRS